MNRIGMRAIKSALVIVICYLVYIGLVALDKVMVEGRMISKWFIPFVAAITAFFSVANSKKDLAKTSLHLWLLYMAVFMYSFLIMGVYVLIANKPWPEIESLEAVDLIIPSILVCIGVVFLGYFMLLANEKKRILNGIVLYLILVSINFYDSNFWQSFLAVFVSITFGVLISYFANLFPVHFKTYNKFLFVYGTDGIYNRQELSFDYYVKYELQELIRRGADITLFTNRSPSTLIPLIGDLKLNIPVICMGGAALYDTTSNLYLDTEPISLELSNKVRGYLNERGIIPFISIIRDNLQYIYKNLSNNIAELRFADFIRNNPYSNYIADEAPNTEVLFFSVVLPSQDIYELINLLKSEGYGNDLCFKAFKTTDVLSDFTDYLMLNIYSKKIEGLRALAQIAEGKTSMAISTSMDDLVLLNQADRIITYKNAPIEIKNKADYVINSMRKHSLIRVIKRFYYHKSSY